MDKIKKVLIWFVAPPTGHVRLQKDMREALVGVTLIAIPDRDCFITNTNDLLAAIGAQRSETVYNYWKAVLETGPTAIFLGRSECEAVHTIQLLAPLPSTGLHKKILRACIGLKVRLPDKAFDPGKNGFSVRRLDLLLSLKYHNRSLYWRRVRTLPGKKMGGTVFLPIHICKPVLR